MANAKCQAWTYVVRPPLHAACCQKGGAGFGYNPNNAACMSGVRTPGPAPGHKGCKLEIDWAPGNADAAVRFCGVSDTVSLLAADTRISLRLFVDQDVAEAYFLGGRVAITHTVVAPAADADWDVAISSSTAEATLASAKSFLMGSIWTTAEEILKARA